MFWLLAMRSGRAAAWLMLAMVICAGGTALLKLYFTACPVGRELTSPSGHTSFSALVYGALAVIVAIEAAAVWSRRLAVALAAILVIGIAVSRLALGAHSQPEVALGLALGLGTLAIFLYGYLNRRPSRVWLAPLLVGVVVIAVALNGKQLRAEQVLRSFGLRLHVASFACPSKTAPI